MAYRLPNKRRSRYFWIMFWLFVLLAFGLLVYIAGVSTGQPMVWSRPPFLVI